MTSIRPEQRLKTFLAPGEILLWCDESANEKIRSEFEGPAFLLIVITAILALIFGTSAGLGMPLKTRNDIEACGAAATLSLPACLAFRPHKFCYGLCNRMVLITGLYGGPYSFYGDHLLKTKIEPFHGNLENRGNLRFNYGPVDGTSDKFRSVFSESGMGVRSRRLSRTSLLMQAEPGLGANSTL